MASRFDAVIVGARAAGAATALLLARAGARVLVVDKGVYGADTLSTHALMRGAVLQLHRWGILPAVIAAGTPAIRSTTFSYRDEDVAVAIEPRDGVDALYAPRRALLDRLLVDAASESGVEFAYGVRVDRVCVNARGRVDGVVAGRLGTVNADIVVGADGLYSTIARLVGAAPIVQGHAAAGVLYSYWENLPADGYYWGFRGDTNLGVIPTNNAACVFVGVAADRFPGQVAGDASAAYRRLIRDAAPNLDAQLTAARRVEPVHGFGGHAGLIRQGAGSGWALVGDAGYFKDPASAHGITDAFRDAELLARAIGRGTTMALSEYESTRLDLSKPLFDITEALVSFTQSDAELQTLHRALSREMAREARAMAQWTLPEHRRAAVAMSA